MFNIVQYCNKDGKFDERRSTIKKRNGLGCGGGVEVILGQMWRDPQLGFKTSGHFFRCKLRFEVRYEIAIETETNSARPCATTALCYTTPLSNVHIEAIKIRFVAPYLLLLLFIFRASEKTFFRENVSEKYELIFLAVYCTLLVLSLYLLFTLFIAQVIYNWR